MCAVQILAAVALTACDTAGGGSGGLTTPSTDSIDSLLPKVTLSASPSAVVLGTTSRLTWSSSNTNACTASGGWAGTKEINGNMEVTPSIAGATSYTLTCSGLFGSSSATTSITAIQADPTKGRFSGSVVNTINGEAINAATISIGGVNGSTGSGGEYLIVDVPPAVRDQMAVSASGFETNYRITPVTAGETTSVSVLAVPVGPATTVTPSAGGDASIASSPGLVRFPAGAIASDSPVTVTVTDLNPASSPENVPGDYTTLVNSVEEQIESFGALTVNIRDAAGAQVSLRDGSTATLRIPVRSLNSALPTSLPLWFYDTNAGRWVQEGTAMLAGSGSDRYYEGTVTHFPATWHAAVQYTAVNVTGCVSSRGQPATNVRVLGTGVDYSGTSTAYTGSDGRFTIRVRPNSQVTLTGRRGGAVSSSRLVQTTDQPLDLGSNCLRIEDSLSSFSIRLTWGSAPLDLDSHLFMPQGGKISFTNKGNLDAEPFVALDVDDVDSFGPEITTVQRARVGTYRFYVNNYSRTSNPGITASPTRVELTSRGTTQVFVPPQGESADTYNWSVFDITVAANCTTTVIRPSAPWNANQPAAPVQSGSSAGAFCTP